MNSKNSQSNSSVRIALVSLNQKWLDKKANFANCRRFTLTAKENKCELIIFPEMTLTGFSLEVDDIYELEYNSCTLNQFGIIAKEIGINIIFGACMRDLARSRPRNHFCLAQSDGSSRGVYTKIHPFSFSGENEVLEAGNSMGIESVGDLKIGASICYDLRFPELFSAMAESCNTFVNIANWPSKRVEHWRALLIARAIENQLFMVGVNRTGEDGNGFLYEESSILVSPEGIVLEPKVLDGEMAIYELDIKDVALYRKKFPTLRDKRSYLYREFGG